MELIDIVDTNCNKIGCIKERYSKLDNNEYALVVHVWIKSEDGRYLVQQRAKTKVVDPLLWSITSGFVTAGESSLETVNRELEEELTVTTDLNEVSYVTRLLPKEGHNHIVDIYMVDKNINFDEIMLQVEEVEAIDYWSKEEILNNINDKVFYDFNLMYDNYFDYIF